MIDILLEPFAYGYMIRAIWVSALVGATCAFLSCYLMLKGWSLMGDALAHAVVPGVALAYVFALPYAVGAFLSGVLAALSMALVRKKTALREDAVIGVVFTAFLSLGLVIASINPVSVSLDAIILGDALAISDNDAWQILVINVITLSVLFFKWRDLKALFFDEMHIRSLGLHSIGLKVLFFTLLSASCVAAIQSVGASLVIAMVITPGATAYLLTDRFERMIMLAVSLGAGSAGFGAYISYFLDASTGGLIVCLQTLLFLAAFFFAPRYGVLFGKGSAV